MISITSHQKASFDGDSLPNSGKEPHVYFDITLQEKPIGRLKIRLFRDVFPAGVENFVGIAAGNTYRIVTEGIGQYKYQKQTRRTYQGCRFFHYLHNNYLVSGDIYLNNGASAGTIYQDQPIPALLGDYYYPHETKGLVSLVPYQDPETKELFYDSTFMITLDNQKPTNLLQGLDDDQVVIGQVYDGLAVLDRMNTLIKPYAGRKYPEFYIGRSGVDRAVPRKVRRQPWVDTS